MKSFVFSGPSAGFFLADLPKLYIADINHHLSSLALLRKRAALFIENKSSDKKTLEDVLTLLLEHEACLIGRPLFFEPKLLRKSVKKPKAYSVLAREAQEKFSSEFQDLKKEGQALLEKVRPCIEPVKCLCFYNKIRALEAELEDLIFSVTNECSSPSKNHK